ncbi:class I poly(R)-hydroxyalkanoic acid synthase [Coralliovum pocilloporae]|uniref:class I poly(R)-hydroxyalkanoic acid synthase n=1 Tax=Coralliovum pocilloporae TaxID=3066369 RepID=UPI003306AB7C
MPDTANDQVTKYLVKDPEQFAQNLTRVMEQVGQTMASYATAENNAAEGSKMADNIAEVVKTFSKVGEYWLSDPQRAIDAQTRLVTQYANLWNTSLRRMIGEPADPAIEPGKGDRRFSDPDWSENQVFDFLKQLYLITASWAEHLVEDSDGVDEMTRKKAEFYIRQISAAASPSNFLLTNPEVLKETLSSNGENLVRGMKMLSEDLEAGHGKLKIRQTDSTKFEVGKNIAVSPGKVVAENDICQLLQYDPSTEKVLKRPLLIVPPWINKFYILDLNPEKSFIRWAVEQGHTVFVISWANPDERQAQKGFEAYMHEGILNSLSIIEKITGEKKVNAIGYCVGGTLLSATLAYMATKNDRRIGSATLFTTQVDFTHAGDLKIFADQDHIQSIEKDMEEKGYLDGSSMASAFNMLRPNDLIWPYVINNYLKGKDPFPFDLLYWNSDSTRMPAANHSYYLRNCYLENKLSQGEMVLDGVKLDLKKVKIPIYNLAAREDHIAPPQSVFLGSGFFGGPVDYVVAGSGHIAGVVNPPSKNKYQFWTGGPAKGSYEDWLNNAEEHPGSWWNHWDAWIRDMDARQVKARKPGGDKINPIEEAPGSFVKQRI